MDTTSVRVCGCYHLERVLISSCSACVWADGVTDDDCVDRHVFQRNSHKNVSLLKERTFESARVRASSFPHLRQWWGPPPFSVPGPSTQLGDALNGYPCPGPSMNMWLNLSATRKAFGVPVDSYFFSGDNGKLSLTHQLAGPSARE